MGPANASPPPALGDPAHGATPFVPAVDGQTRRARAGLVVLVLSDLIPLAGVLLFGWEVFPLLLLFWAENVVVGVVTVFKMNRAEGAELPSNGWTPNTMGSPHASLGETPREVSVAAFCLGYGIFAAVHLFFLVALFGTRLAPGVSAPTLAPLAGVATWPFLLAVASLVIAQVVDYRRDYVGRGEYRDVSPSQVAEQPFARVAALHMAIVLGGAVVAMLGSPIGGLLLLVGVKTAFDVQGFIRRRRGRRLLILGSDEVALLDEHAPDRPPF